MVNNLINWGVVVDRHLLGLTPLGKVFIRLNKENKVTGMYTMFEQIEKFVPKDETQESLESAKKTLFEIVKNKIEKDILLKKDFQL
jgi:hypothetical protein